MYSNASHIRFQSTPIYLTRKLIEWMVFWTKFGDEFEIELEREFLLGEEVRGFEVILVKLTEWMEWNGKLEVVVVAVVVILVWSCERINLWINHKRNDIKYLNKTGIKVLPTRIKILKINKFLVNIILV